MAEGRASAPARAREVFALVGRWTASHWRAIESFGVGLAAVLLLAWRAPFAMSKFWAEDGAVFLQQAKRLGTVRSLGHGYAGYFLLLNRVIGSISSVVPVAQAALITWVGVAVATGWCASTIYVESEGWLATAPTRLLLAFSIVLLPALGLESIASAASLQYILLFTSLVALTGRARSPWRAANRAAIVAVTGLSTPLALFLAPLAVLRVLWSRPRRVDVTVAAWAIATAVQFGMILIVQPRRNVGSPGQVRRIVTNYEHRVLYKNLLPNQVAAQPLIAPFMIFVGVVLIVLAIIVAWRRSRRRTAALLTLVPLTGFVFWTYASINYGSPPRYRVFPALCVVWTVLVAWEELVRSPSARSPVDWRLASIVVVLLAISWTTYWKPAPYRSSGPSWATALATAARTCRNHQNQTVAVKISPVAPGSANWAVRLTCDAVLNH